MKNRRLDWLALFISIVLTSRSAWSVDPPKTHDRPNIVLIVADDLGASDIGCYGADLLETPRLDRLATEGIQFTQAYAMSVCSPSRAMLLSGKHAARLGITIWAEGSLKGPTNRKLLQAESLHDLPHGEWTLAESLQSNGYLTALIGKWHLGDADHFPESQGFDVNIGGNHWGAPETFWSPYRGSGRFGKEFRYVPHLEFGKPNEYLTDRLTEEAIQVIDQAGDKPFFVYLAHYAPHTPIEAKPTDVEYFSKKLKPEHQHRNPIYAAMVKNLDENVGRVLDHLEAKKLSEKTIVVFTSDNGGYIGIDRRSGQSSPVTSNAPLRSGKGSLYEGGIRVPLIIRHPSQVKATGTCPEPVTLSDIHATLVHYGQPNPGNNTATNPPTDGLDLSPLLRVPGSRLNRDELYFHYPHYYETTTPASAVRSRDWKLIEYFEDGHLELYNLGNDPSERNDLSKTHPEIAVQLHRELRAWRETVDAKMPTPNIRE